MSHAGQACRMKKKHSLECFFFIYNSGLVRPSRLVSPSHLDWYLDALAFAIDDERDGAGGLG